MKIQIQIVFVQSKKLKPFEAIDEMYLDKLKHFCDIDLIAIKSEDIDRKNKEIKKQKESEKILQKIKPEDYVFLCDERGHVLSSETFSEILMKQLEVYKRVVFVIGGAFGVDSLLKSRANATLSLSKFVFNHHIAKIVLEEQIYRAFMIAKNIPYHNE